MASKYTQLGPWPLGMDNVHPETHKVFQVPGQGENPARLRTATDVNLTDEGWPIARAGLETALSLTEGKESFAFAGKLYVQDGEFLYRKEAAVKIPILSGLSSMPLAVCEIGGNLFWSDGVKVGKLLRNGLATNWSCSIPDTPTVRAVGGELAVGKYHIATTFVDVNGVEHGASDVLVAEVTAPCGLEVALGTPDSAATAVRVYASQPNGDTLYLIGQYAVNARPVIYNVWNSTAKLRTKKLFPPIAATELFTYRGYLMLVAGNALFPSYGANFHLFEYDAHVEMRESDILAGAGLTEGFWTVTENGAFWTTGDTPDKWDTVQQDMRCYAAGSLVVPGPSIPMLKTNSNVALFVSDIGVMAGLSSGEIVPLTQNRYHCDVRGKRCKIASGLVDEQQRFYFVLMEK